MRSPADIIHNGRSLAAILVAHTAWLRGKEGGERADLGGAYLGDANLGDATGNMVEIKSLHIDTWPAAWVQSPEGETTVQIGCQRHPLEMWRKADPRWIAAMDAQATGWWAKHGAMLLAVIDANPATPYGKAKDAA